MEKMYVLIRKDLTKNQQAVQGGHAVARYLIQHPHTTWRNGTLVYLGIKNLDTFRHWIWKLGHSKKNFTVFTEPDLDHQPTALAIVSDEDELFKDLLLI